MTKITAIKAIKDNNEEVHYGLTLDQLDGINSKIHFALSTLDILRSMDMDTDLNIESLITLAQEAHDRLKEAEDILTPEREQTALPDAPGCVKGR